MRTSTHCHPCVLVRTATHLHILVRTTTHAYKHALPPMRTSTHCHPPARTSTHCSHLGCTTLSPITHPQTNETSHPTPNPTDPKMARSKSPPMQSFYDRLLPRWMTDPAYCLRMGLDEHGRPLGHNEAPDGHAINTTAARRRRHIASSSDEDSSNESLLSCALKSSSWTASIGVGTGSDASVSGPSVCCP